MKQSIFRMLGGTAGTAVYWLIYAVTDWPVYGYWAAFLLLMCAGICSADRVYFRRYGK